MLISQNISNLYSFTILVMSSPEPEYTNTNSYK